MRNQKVNDCDLKNIDKPHRLFVTGIGTNVGKTVVSAILTEHLKADYWKPVQSGDLLDSDTLTVKKLVTNNQTVFHNERFRLSKPLSPHAAAKLDHESIQLSDFVVPSTSNHLVIEGAGGVLVPLNEGLLLADLIKHVQAKVVVVSQIYLGSINHTLLTIEELKRRNIDILGIVFNGEYTPETENFILHHTTIPVLFRIDKEEKITSDIISSYASSFSL